MLSAHCKFLFLRLLNTKVISVRGIMVLRRRKIVGGLLGVEEASQEDIIREEERDSNYAEIEDSFFSITTFCLDFYLYLWLWNKACI
jgi:hypothetical protein